MQFTIARNIAELKTVRTRLRMQGQWLAFVPTMGALHAGHASLIRAGFDYGDAVGASIFVNPAQFGAGEDFSRYPRQLEADAEVLREAGAAFCYAPPVEEVYPAGFATTVSVRGVSEGLEGAHRPGHFDGVATVVAKLLMTVQPEAALFGEKDYQQLQVIRAMVRDLNIPLRIAGVPTLREADGLAFSSRNAYLGAEERARAPRLYAALREAAGRLMKGEDAATVLAAAKAALAAAGFRQVDYFALADGETLAELSKPVRGARLLAAAWLGNTRLIDNISVEEP